MKFEPNWPLLISKYLSMGVALTISTSAFANPVKCMNLFEGGRTNDFIVTSGQNNDHVVKHENTNVNKMTASWEMSRIGIGEIVAKLHGMDNIIYYALSALMTKEHILVDGPGGGAKTLGIRNVFEAQLKSVNSLSDKDRQSLTKESNALKANLIEIILQDRQETDPAKKIFTQQLHATLSDTKFLGGPDPFAVIREGDYKNDYSRALISDKNMFAILDEIEKGPVALQMTLLSILNERQALVGNQIIKTMLESIAATTNASLGEMIGQALPHEVGGRRALVDRFAYKIHSINVNPTVQDGFLMIEKIDASKRENKFVIIDVRGLRPLMDRVVIPNELLSAASDITLQMDREYTRRLIDAQEKVKGTPQAPDFYPPFSGSTRSQSKLVKMWSASFIVRQLMDGVAFENVQLTMKPKDLIDIAPVVLQGGPDLIVPQQGYRVSFLQAQAGGIIPMVVSNAKTARAKELQVSYGRYEPTTQTFSYMSNSTLQIQRVKFDPVTQKFLTNDPKILEEIAFDTSLAHFNVLNSPVRDRMMDLSKTLSSIHNGTSKKGKNWEKEAVQFETTGKIQQLLHGENGIRPALRAPSRKQLEEIADFHQDFLSVVNTAIRQLSNTKMTAVDKSFYKKQEDFFKHRGTRMKAMLRSALNSNNPDKIEDAAALSVRNAFYELNYKFLEAGSNIKSIFLAMLNRKNVMLFGPPGSAKTMLTRMILDAELFNIAEAQVANASSILAEALLTNKAGPDSLWIKQFHPMSNEGEVIGRLDLKGIEQKKGYTYNRSGTMSAKEVLFSLLDEFEKAPAGVKTALLSILNEREILDGDEVVLSNIIAVVVATNSTPGEFLISLGQMSSAFPIFDRIQNKAYSLNKLTADALKEFHRRVYAKADMNLQSPLFIHPLTKLARTYKLEPYEKKLLIAIHAEFMHFAVNERSDPEHLAHLGDPQAFPDFYMNSRGESNRSLGSVIADEFTGAVFLNKILRGVTPKQIRAQGNTFDPVDLVAFSELFTSFNGFYRIEHDYMPGSGLIFFKVVETNLSTVMDRIDNREKKTIEDMKFEAEKMAEIINRQFMAYYKNQEQLFRDNPHLYPSLFASEGLRAQQLKLRDAQKPAGAQ